MDNDGQTEGDPANGKNQGASPTLPELLEGIAEEISNLNQDASRRSLEEILGELRESSQKAVAGLYQPRVRAPRFLRLASGLAMAYSFMILTLGGLIYAGFLPAASHFDWPMVFVLLLGHLPFLFVISSLRVPRRNLYDE